ncbi:MAG: hypothetical protein LDLANPLL_01705 [Turneriella sp.]|nr:hypothetical protein [Turneriella sp.]
MRKNNSSNGKVKEPFERMCSLFGFHADKECVFAFTENLYPVVRKVFKKAVQGKPWTVNVNFMERAAKVGVFVD